MALMPGKGLCQSRCKLELTYSNSWICISSCQHNNSLVAGGVAQTETTYQKDWMQLPAHHLSWAMFILAPLASTDVGEQDVADAMACLPAWH